MSLNRYAKKVDANQNQIVASLNNIPGVTVALDHHDILVGYKGITYWFEIKSPGNRKKSGDWKAGALEKSQIKLLQEWTGFYKVVDSLDEILYYLGIK